MDKERYVAREGAKISCAAFRNLIKENTGRTHGRNREKKLLTRNRTQQYNRAHGRNMEKRKKQNTAIELIKDIYLV